MIQICINKTKICIINVCVYNAKVQRFLTFFSNEKCFFRQCLKQSKKKSFKLHIGQCITYCAKAKYNEATQIFFSCVSVSSLQTNNPTTFRHYARFHLRLWFQAMHSLLDSRVLFIQLKNDLRDVLVVWRFKEVPQSSSSLRSTRLQKLSQKSWILNRAEAKNPILHCTQRHTTK